MAKPTIQRLLDSGVQFGEISQKQAKQLVKQLAKAGEVQRRDTERLVNDLVMRGREGTERMNDLVQREVSKQMATMSAQLDDLQNRMEEFTNSIGSRLQGGDQSPAPASTTATKKAAAKKSTAKKAAASTPAANVAATSPDGAAGSSGVAPIKTTRDQRDAD